MQSASDLAQFLPLIGQDVLCHRYVTNSSASPGVGRRILITDGRFQLVVTYSVHLILIVSQHPIRNTKVIPQPNYLLLPSASPVFFLCPSGIPWVKAAYRPSTERPQDISTHPDTQTFPCLGATSSAITALRCHCSSQYLLGPALYPSFPLLLIFPLSLPHRSSQHNNRDT